LVYYGSVFFATSYFILVLPGQDESQALILLIIVAAGEVVGAVTSGFLIGRGVKRAHSCCAQLCICGTFMLLMLSNDNVYARAVFAMISRAFIFGTFTTIYQWTPSVLPSHLRTSGMGVVSSFGKIASICAPFIPKENVMVPSLLFGLTAFATAVLVLFVGVEPHAVATYAAVLSEPEGETSPLVK
jgi:putative MFS transporter